MPCCRSYHVLTIEEVEAHVIPTVEQIPGSQTFDNSTDFIDQNEINQVWADSSKHSARALMAAYLWERSRALALLELIKIGRTVLWRFTFLSHSLKFQHDGCFPKDMSTNQSCWFWNRRKARRRCKFIVKNLCLSPPLIPLEVRASVQADWQLCLECGAVCGASGLVIFRWIEIIITF